MAKQQQPTSSTRKLIQLTRNAAGARYGETSRLTDQEITEHGFTEGDYKVPDEKSADTPADNDRSTNSGDTTNR